ncbi:bifunctional folylpolyglutamate synthase/dihydrofolate synthase [Streptococcus suis]|uniref:bifunctional folylpolyglutamate synthase/dihydrofolate synthase n=1 Tax=Streptococcus suis TaxID=1307 RepID=UPI002117E9EB|nr:folylpolyglutamate synthase/dihydrofolate synthase family protein [Streptococcus suis]MCQ8272438.1 bifunctional folylpolyglutamate synthase/dihydrofolate synthase [Streptococcus suis]MDY7599471.1 folylpolyglutamate synthase/dihydrofolate synthase family protein [Streptococcus suis]UUM49560.1 bifunctional folylpolyglutamate synthase/dihydrofolate synthase [Streptococcus suis]HEL1770703.1 bifunctional folylpolyglutamate synthase/dihydrofolate synthase [Streptococcus suis]HEL1783480.1 bifuncti
MNYLEMRQWLSSRPASDLENGVARVKWLLERLDNPQLQVPTVHFVGTNGKGSTLNALQSILRSSGYTVGRFTSPSIIDFREQIVYQQEMISEEDFARIVTDLQPLIEDLDQTAGLDAISEFEIVVVAMFVYFAHYQRPDILLVEAGMGGLQDATNVLASLAVVCPSIGLDHQAFLGEIHAAIARHKVAVLREGVPLVYATDLPEVVAVFEEQARQLQSPTYAVGREILLENSRAGFAVSSPFGRVEDLRLQMQGRHQEVNAALAVTTAQLISPHFPTITNETIRQGLSQAIWPGRLELIRPNLMIDGAHNNESISVLTQHLEEKYADRDIEILFAAINTKPVDQMLSQLSQFGPVSVTTFDDFRAVQLEDYPSGYERVQTYQEWLEQADLDNLKKLYLITGSLYFITHVRKYVLEKLF